MQRPKNYREACKMLDKDPNIRPDNSMLTKKEAKFYDTKYEMDVIADAIRNKWKANYANDDERKWRPWFEWDDSLSAFRFLVAVYDYALAHAGSGSRQVFETEDDAIYYGEQFIKQHNIILNF